MMGMLVSAVLACSDSPVGTTDGYKEISFGDTCDLKITYVSKNAGYTNTFGYVSSGTRTVLGVSNTAVAGTVYDIGEYPAGSPVIVYLKSGEYPSRFYYSDGSGPDDHDYYDHAKVTKIDENTYSVEFEDVYNHADWDYNDVVLSVTCTPLETQNPVPEFPTPALPVSLLIGLLGAVFFIRNTREN